MKLGGVYLSPSCFTMSSLQRPPSPQWIANYWVYLGQFQKGDFLKFNLVKDQILENIIIFGIFEKESCVGKS